MKRPWQVWTLFFLGLALVVPPMAWLSIKALELDRNELAARQQMDLEERINRALWRIDSLLMPLLAQEAARPDFVYQSVVTAVATEGKGKGNAQQAVSPLLLSPPDYVLVHFELHPDGSICSPQSPLGKEAAWAVSNGVPEERISAARERLAQLAGQLDHPTLWAELPDESLPPVDVLAPAWNSVASSVSNRSQIVANTFDQARPSQQGGYLAPNPPAQPPPPNASPDGVQQQEQESAQQPAQQAAVPQSGLFTGARSSRGRSQLSNDNDLQSRGQAFQNLAQRTYQDQRLNYGNSDPAARTTIQEGVSQPLWIGDRLILARRVKSGATTVIQGCWLDWEKLEARLRNEIADLDLPDIRFARVTDVAAADQKHLLVTVPVELMAGVPAVDPAWDSPIRVSLLAAWGCLVLAAVFAAVTLRGVVALSERRGAFVSAVTHELRTPLTTFRMYAEMLAEGMVPSAEQRQKYLETLRREADRLAHLVENVLQFARLERGRPARNNETLPLASLLDRIQPRLADRAEQAEMKLVAEIDDNTRSQTVTTDCGAVEQILFNLVDNACKYAAAATDKRIHLEATTDDRCVTIRVRDHGPGISHQQRRRLFVPFSKSAEEAARTAPGVGLGLSLSRRLARDLRGKLELAAASDGAEFVLTLPRR